MFFCVKETASVTAAVVVVVEVAATIQQKYKGLSFFILPLCHRMLPLHFIKLPQI